MSTRTCLNTFQTFSPPELYDGFTLTTATFTLPGTPKNAKLDETNSYGVVLDKEQNGLIYLQMDGARFYLTPAQARVLAARLMEVSLEGE